MKPNWLLLASLLVPLPALAQDATTPPAIAPSAQGDVSVTIYNGDVALVQDIRPLDLRSGPVRQDFPDVSAQIRPETVSLAVPDARIVEQNFDFDLLSPSSLMEKAVGETITLLRTNPATGAETRERARVLAVNGGVVLQIGDRIEVLRDDGLPVRAIFDKVPPSLRARPTLSVTLDSARSGTRPATLSYLSRGLGWKADYVALLDRKSGTIDVQGWVTLTNTTGTTFTNARTLLVAGEVGSSDDEDAYPPRPPRRRPLQQSGTETANREQLGDFYLYPLPERTTIADKQTKQVSFLDVKGTPATSGYRFVNNWLGTTEQPVSAQSIVRFSNAAKGGLGDALPAGTIRVYMRDARGQPQFTGEAAIDHTPQGSKIALATGDAFDVKVRAIVESRTRINANRWQTKMRYTLTNAMPGAVTVELAQGGLDWSDTRIIDQSRPSERVDAGQAVWQVPVPANGSATVTATFDTRY
ncbi:MULTISPECIES: DUF4139 domain-containing protein [unclassified Sphingomonas]|uniref:DUF4139 domain-containing protein n=1 Tax=unclassified Sphingomonas TaxID=196159 RepID=UPI0006F5C189|nr:MULTISPECIES: DUF4139 domain-containing protein [unclassified Sphingomonas]KQM27760.1 hypothetical protein ASE58_05260 [Sphingomonas sp. Leaf9]KQM44100.1 hypothetical protein ASE57_05255 [Sphingomonas sp. Leaf11]